MIHYNTEGYAIAIAFNLTGSVFPSASSMAIVPALAAAVLAWLRQSEASWLPTWFYASVEEYSLFQTFAWILGFILVFRTSQAYTRYWEGAQLLHAMTAEWYDACLQCTAFASTSGKSREEISAFNGTLIRLFSLLHCSALQQVSVMEDDKFLVLDARRLDTELLSCLSRFEHCRTQEDRRQRTEVIFLWITRFVLAEMRSNLISTPPPIVTRAFQELNSGMAALNKMVTITDTPLPMPYVQMIALLLVFSMILTPFVVAAKASHPVWAFLFTFVAVCMQWSVNLIAKEIEQPFGDDINDFDLAEAQQDFNDSLLLLVDDQVCWPLPTGRILQKRGELSEGRLSISNLRAPSAEFSKTLQRSVSDLFKDDDLDPEPQRSASGFSTASSDFGKTPSGNFKKKNRTGTERWERSRSSAVANRSSAVANRSSAKMPAVKESQSDTRWSKMRGWISNVPSLSRLRLPFRKKLDIARTESSGSATSSASDPGRFTARRTMRHTPSNKGPGISKTPPNTPSNGGIQASDSEVERKVEIRKVTKESTSSTGGPGGVSFEESPQKAIALDGDPATLGDSRDKVTLDGDPATLGDSQGKLEDAANDVSAGGVQLDVAGHLDHAGLDQPSTMPSGPNITLDAGFCRKGLDDDKTGVMSSSAMHLEMPPHSSRSAESVHENRSCAAMPAPDFAEHVAYFQVGRKHDTSLNERPVLHLSMVRPPPQAYDVARQMR